MMICLFHYLGGGEFLAPVLVVLGEDPGMKHRRVSGVCAVLAAEHPEGELGVVDHRGHDQLRLAESPPVGPRALEMTRYVEATAGRGLGGRRR